MSRPEEDVTLPPPVPVDRDATLPPAESPTVPSPTNPAATPTPNPVAPPSGPDTRAPAGYAIEKELGRGGMGVVYLARDVKLARRCALKMILSGAHSGTAEVARFLTEAQAIARLQHPGIVQVFEIGEHDGRPFMALEFCGGGSLDAVLAKNPLEPRRAAELVRLLAEAMQAAHAANVLHRDLKPANVLLAAGGQPKVTDFGLAKKLDEEGATRTGSVMGTPSYMPPEQADGKKDLGPAADIYALGAILYECLTGRPPFRAATALDTILQVLTEEAVPLRQLNATVPVDLETVAHKCLQKDPARRYASAKELADDLGRFLAGEPVHARPVGALERGVRWVRRNPVVASLTAAVFLVLALGAGVAAVLAGWARGEAANATRALEEATRQQNRAEANAAEAVKQAGIARDKTGLAESALAQARDQLARTELALYANQLGQAQREWQDGDAALARRLLRECPAGQRGPEHRLLWTQYAQEPRLLEGQDQAIHRVAFHPEGGRVAAAGGEGTVVLWDVADRKEIRRFDGHKDHVWSVAFRPDGKQLVSAGEDGSVRVWDGETGQEQTVFAEHLGKVRAACFSPDGRRVLSGGFDPALRVFEAAGGKEVLTIPHRHRAVFAVGYRPDGKELATAGLDRLIELRDAETGASLRTLKGHTDKVNDLAYAPDGKRLASAGSDGTVRLWDPGTGRELLQLAGHKLAVLGVAFSPDGQRVVSSGEDGTVRVWEAATGQELFLFRGHRDHVATVAFRPDGKQVASGGRDQTLRVWPADQRPPAHAVKSRGLIQALAAGTDGAWLATAGAAGHGVRLWDVSDGKSRGEIPLPPGDHRALALDRDGNRLAVAASRRDAELKPVPGDVVLWDVGTRRERAVLKGHAGGVEGLAFNPDGRWLASASTDETVRLWDLPTGLAKHTLTGHGRPVSCVVFSPDGQGLYSGGWDGTVHVWEVATGRKRRALKGHAESVTCVAASADGRFVAAGAMAAEGAGAIRVWDAASGEERLALRAHTDDVTSLDFSPDGRRLASASSDGTVKLWEMPRGQELLTLKGHGAQVAGVRFDPKGRYLATCGGDGTLRIAWTDQGPPADPDRP